jgi:predicted aspartyl protease
MKDATRWPDPFAVPRKAMLLLALLCGTAVAVAQCPEAPGARHVIPFRWTPGQIEVQVSVNGHPGEWFVVDTGAEYSILDQQLAKSLQLPVFRRGQRDFARGVTLRIGAVELSDQEVMILPLENFRRQGRAIVGLIGYDLFARYVVSFDYLARTMTICDPRAFQPPRGATTVPLTFAGRLAVVPVTIALDDTQSSLAARVILDTGASQSLILRYPFADARGLIDRARQYQTAVAGSVESATVAFLQLPVKSVSLAGSSFPAVVLRIYSQPANAGGDTRTDGALGNGILSHFRVTLDYSRKQMYLEPNQNPR